MGQPFHDLAAADLSELVRLAAPSRASNLPVVERQEALYARLGWRAVRVPVDDDGPPRASLLVTRDDAPEVLFSCPVDTVAPGRARTHEGHGRRPREAVPWDGRLFGPGAGGSLASAAVLDALAATGRLPSRVALAFTAEGQVGGIGAGRLLRSGRLPRTVRDVVVCEPTANRVVRGQKGYVPFDVVMRGAIRPDCPGGIDTDEIRIVAVVGQEAHSSRPGDGHNALFEAAGLDDLAELVGETVLGVECRGSRNKVPGFMAVHWLPRSRPLLEDGTHPEVPLGRVLDFLRRLQDLAETLSRARSPCFDPPEVTLNVGALSLDGPDLVLSCDLRPIPGFDPVPVLDAVLNEARAVFHAASLRAPFPPRPAVWTDLPASLVAALGDRVAATGKSSFSEAAVYADAGMRALIAGPGDPHAQRPDESVAVADFDPAGDLFLALAGHLPGT